MVLIAVTVTVMVIDRAFSLRQEHNTHLNKEKFSTDCPLSATIPQLRVWLRRQLYPSLPMACALVNPFVDGQCRGDRDQVTDLFFGSPQTLDLGHLYLQHTHSSKMD